MRQATIIDSAIFEAVLTQECHFNPFRIFATYVDKFQMPLIIIVLKGIRQCCVPFLGSFDRSATFLRQF